tara:strand:- start:470 stop:1009 length:540 start_codon:yes stop_codon:yes gene_type:complete
MSTLHVENLKGLSSGGNANKIIVPTGQTLEVTDNIRYDDMPAGSVIQFKNYTGNTYTNIGSTDTWADVAATPTVTITPKFANSLIVYRIYAVGIASNCQGVGVRLMRGGSDVFTNDRHAYSDTNSWTQLSFDVQAYDLPNTTSSVTYTLQVKKQAGLLRFNDYAAVLNKYITTVEEIKQ